MKDRKEAMLAVIVREGVTKISELDDLISRLKAQKDEMELQLASVEMIMHRKWRFDDDFFAR